MLRLPTAVALVHILILSDQFGVGTRIGLKTFCSIEEENLQKHRIFANIHVFF